MNREELLQQARSILGRYEPSTVEYQVARYVKNILLSPARGDGLLAQWPRAVGVTRMFDNNQALLLSMEREPTDDELRALHDALAGRATPNRDLEELLDALRDPNISIADIRRAKDALATPTPPSATYGTCKHCGKQVTHYAHKLKTGELVHPWCHREQATPPIAEGEYVVAETLKQVNRFRNTLWRAVQVDENTNSSTRKMNEAWEKEHEEREKLEGMIRQLAAPVSTERMVEALHQIHGRRGFTDAELSAIENSGGVISITVDEYRQARKALSPQPQEDSDAK